jgi:2-phosphosulfolactate phosphatase
MRIETILDPGGIARLPERDLSQSVCVVFDVLRATSTILTALAHGASRIYPAVSVEEARLWRQTRLPDAALCGERKGVRVPGFDFGNSPAEFTRDAVSGRTLIMSTTNGTVALRACAGAREVHAGALLNLGALAAAARASAPGTLLLVCAGTGGRFAVEDGFAAGALISRLGAPAALDDASQAMLALYEQSASRPLELLAGGENGRRLSEIGLSVDLGWCARYDVFAGLAVLRDGSIEGRALEM